MVEESKKKRIKTYEIIDLLNDMDNQIYESMKSHEVRDKFKRIKKLIRDL